MHHLLLLWREDGGQDLVEYALLVILLALAIVASIRSLGKSVSDAFSNASANLASTS
jgi:Flp pilus assembly pilin Flp